MPELQGVRGRRAGSTLAQLVAAGTVQAHYHGMAFLDTTANDQYSTRALNAAAVVVDAAGPRRASRSSTTCSTPTSPPESGSGLTDDQLVAYADQAGATGADRRRQRDQRPTYGDWVQDVDRPGQQGRRDRHADRVRRRQEARPTSPPAGLTAAVARRARPAASRHTAGQARGRRLGDGRHVDLDPRPHPVPVRRPGGRRAGRRFRRRAGHRHPRAGRRGLRRSAGLGAGLALGAAARLGGRRWGSARSTSRRSSWPTCWPSASVCRPGWR